VTGPEFWIWLLAYATFVGVTLLLGVASGDMLADWVHPKMWIWIPVAGLLVGCGPLLFIMNMLEITWRLTGQRGDWVLTGTLWGWSALMIWFRTGHYRDKRKRTRAEMARARAEFESSIQNVWEDSYGTPREPLLARWRTRP
jgi:hypothetical protein